MHTDHDLVYIDIPVHVSAIVNLTDSNSPVSFIMTNIHRMLTLYSCMHVVWFYRYHTLYTMVWVCGYAFKQNSGSTIAERAIDNVGVSSYPTKNSHTTKDIARLAVKHIL